MCPSLHRNSTDSLCERGRRVNEGGREGGRAERIMGSVMMPAGHMTVKSWQANWSHDCHMTGHALT